jgi:hypothetical protein
MRGLILMACLLLGGWTQAAPVDYQRGDFHFSVAPAPAFVQRHEIPASWDPAAPGANDAPWRFWLYDRQVDRRSGHDAMYTDYAYEATSSSLLGDAGRYQLDFNPGYQQLTIHAVEIRRNGTWQNRLEPERISLARRETAFDNDMTDGEVTALIVLDDVRVNDVVRIAYTVTGSNPVLAGQSMDSIALAWANPMLDSHLRIVADAGTRFGVNRENGAPEPVLRDTQAGSEISFDGHAAAAVVEEGNYPAWFQPYPLVQVSAKRGWADVVAWALPLYPPGNTLPADLDARIAQWAKLPTPRARLKSALRAVQDEVRYFGVEMGDNTHRPSPPTDTWQRRRGDCKDKAYLLVTILQRLGIDSVPALTSISRGRAILAYPESAAAFDHVIVRAQLDGKPVWVDPTLAQTGGEPGSVDLSRYGAALPIRGGVAALEPIPTSGPDITGVDVAEQLTPLQDGKIALQVTSIYRGIAADNTRQNIASRRIEDIARKYADFYRKRYGDLDMLAAPEVKNDRDANIVTVVEHYRLDAAFKTDDAQTRSIDLYADALSAPAALPSSMSRMGPLYLAAPGEYRHTIRVVVPQQWHPLFGIESEHYRTPTFDYRRELGFKDGAVVLDYDMVVHDYEIGAGAVAAQIEELRKVNDSLSARLRYTLPGRMDPAERDRRLQDLIRDAMGQEARK